MSDAHLSGATERSEPTTRVWSVVTLFARLALSAGFLSAVADRFGLWGDAGTGDVTWGTYDAYLDYVHDLAPYLPDPLVDLAGGGATAAELILGLTLLFGVALRWSAWLGGAVLLVFALSMFFFNGVQSPFNASVFAAASAILLLALAPRSAYAFSLAPHLGPNPPGVLASLTGGAPTAKRTRQEVK
ncbi:hypothetical protein [Streptomyces sp. NPDC059063]|uniref:hypothetical protein n=1 Tax=unclassified Streptomyces TaxID=2593676 RepID=UPI0036CAFFA3